MEDSTTHSRPVWPNNTLDSEVLENTDNAKDGSTVTERDDGKDGDTDFIYAQENAHGNAERSSGDLDEDGQVEHHDPPKKRKRKRTRPASKRGIGKPTGMEEFYADAPLTAEQFEEYKEIYNPSIPFMDRLATAIQRFERTRRLTPERSNVFYKWLHYGSIETGQNMFVGGVDQENMDKDQLASALSRMTISDKVREEVENRGIQSDKYVVDFEGCMRGFLSHRAHDIWSLDSKEQINLVTTTLERFMDYLSQHDVCPEYKEDILRTRNLCRDAESQLWDCSEVQRWLPGDFNMACSTLFEGEYSRIHDGQTYWGPEDQAEDVFVGFTAEKATQIVGFAIAGAASEDVYQTYHDNLHNDAGRTLEVVRIIEGHGFEITHIETPSAECKDLYITQSENLRPVGRIFAKAWRNPEAAPDDLTPAEKEQDLLEEDAMKPEDYTFFVEEVILQHLMPGQKILATISLLNCGIWFLDQVLRVFPSFEVYLLNEMTLGYKEPRTLTSLNDSSTDQAEETHEETAVQGQADHNLVATIEEDPDALNEGEPY